MTSYDGFLKTEGVLVEMNSLDTLRHSQTLSGTDIFANRSNSPNISLNTFREKWFDIVWSDLTLSDTVFKKKIQ